MVVDLRDCSDGHDHLDSRHIPIKKNHVLETIVSSHLSTAD